MKRDWNCAVDHRGNPCTCSYGISELKRARFSAEDVQIILNEKRNLELKIKQLEQENKDLKSFIGIERDKFGKRETYLMIENARLRKALEEISEGFMDEAGTVIAKEALNPLGNKE